MADELQDLKTFVPLRGLAACREPRAALDYCVAQLSGHELVEHFDGFLPLPGPPNSVDDGTEGHLVAERRGT